MIFLCVLYDFCIAVLPLWRNNKMTELLRINQYKDSQRPRTSPRYIIGKFC